MLIFRTSKFLALALCCGLSLTSLRSMAEDIDIYVGSSGGSSAAPKVMIFLDNSTNDLFPEKIAGINQVLDSITATNPMQVGLAMWSPRANCSNSGNVAPTGAYIRFAPRDMSIAANRTALKNILNGINANIGTNNELSSTKDEPSAFYEIYKFFSSLAPFAGSSSLNKNPNVDKSGNNGCYTSAYGRSTAFGQGLTSGFAFQPGDALYQSDATTCGKNYIVYMAANNNYQASNVQGLQTYEGVSAGTELPAITGAPGHFWGDEWTRTLYANNNPKIVTYVLDAASTGNGDAVYTAVLQAEAKQGGGTWQFVSSQAQIVTALTKIFAEIKAVNSSFASASLPVNTTNRAQDKNQVFIPMFRPDPDAKPRWMGNLKQYQLITSGGSVMLGDSAGQSAVNPQTGFPTDCATSFWTTDSGTYWQNVSENPSPAGNCTTTSFNKFSDAPDGPIVEKGGVAEIIRKGNNPPTTDTTPTWAVNRTIYTQSGSSLTAFNTTSSGLSSALVNFIQGQDVNDENANTNLTETRPSLHGDAIHSRPLPIDYGGTTGVTYYGANDGTLRAIDSATGKERWALIAPEFFSRLSRLMTNSPLISYPPTPAAGSTRKDYFFDGSIGVYQNADNSKVWIYPSMRRGGRMIYALDVSNPNTAPYVSYKWKAGCPNLADDTGCTTGMSGIGQTWSIPSAVFIKGYSITAPVIVVGGGYDTCEDADSASPTCGAPPKGGVIYVLNADTGGVIASFATTRSVAADISFIDIDNDGFVDYAYAADTGGNIYRIDFINNPTSKTPLASTNWSSHRVAYTAGAGRKFLFSPALLTNSGKVYVAIGSGDREHPLISHYPYAGVTNRFYVYLDNLASTSATPADNLDDTTKMQDFTSARTCTDAPILPTSTLKGWFMNLNQNGQGEQTVTSALIAAGMVTFSTNRPIPAAAGSCSTTLGEARGYFVNLFNGSGAIGVTGSCGGSRSGTFIGGGLPPSPVIGTVPVGGKPITVVIGAVQRAGGASSTIAPQQVKPTIVSKRRRTYLQTSTDN